MPKIGDLKIWWVPQVPMKAFEMKVGTTDEASLLLFTLAKYDIFQFENRVKPDFSNAGGLSVFDGEEWTEWESDLGDTIDDIIDGDIESGRF